MNHESPLEQLAVRFTQWVGSISSLIVHTIIFAAAFVFVLFGISIEKVLLVLTTALSLEAIYLAIFIQMSVNRQSESIKEVEEDIDEIQEDIDEIQEDVEGIEEDIVVMTEEEQQVEDQKMTIDKIHGDLQRLLDDFQKLKNQTLK